MSTDMKLGAEGTLGSSTLPSGDYIKRMEKAVLLANVKINELQKENQDLKLRLERFEVENRKLTELLKKSGYSSSGKVDKLSSTSVSTKKRSISGYEISHDTSLANDLNVEIGNDANYANSDICRNPPIKKKTACVPEGKTSKPTLSSSIENHDRNGGPNQSALNHKQIDCQLQNHTSSNDLTPDLIQPLMNGGIDAAISSSDDDDDWLIEGISAATATAAHLNSYTVESTLASIPVQEKDAVKPTIDNPIASIDAETKSFPGHEQLAAMSPSVATITIVQNLNRQNIRQAATLLVHYAPSIVSKSICQHISSVFNRKEQLAALLEFQQNENSSGINPSMLQTIDLYADLLVLMSSIHFNGQFFCSQVLKGLRHKICIRMTLMLPRPTSSTILPSNVQIDAMNTSDQKDKLNLVTASSITSDLRNGDILDEQIFECQEQVENPEWSSLTDLDFIDKEDFDDKKRLHFNKKDTDLNNDDDGFLPEQVRLQDGSQGEEESDAISFSHYSVPTVDSCNIPDSSVVESYRKIIFGSDVSLLVKTILLIKTSIQLNLQINVIALFRELGFLVTSRRLFESHFQSERNKESFRHPYIGCILGIVHCYRLLQPHFICKSSISLTYIELSIQGYEVNFPVVNTSSPSAHDFDSHEFSLAQTLIRKCFKEFSSLMRISQSNHLNTYSRADDSSLWTENRILQLLKSGFSDDIDCRKVVDKLSQSKLLFTRAEEAAVATCLFHMIGPLPAILRCNQLSINALSVGALDLLGLSRSFLNQINAASAKNLNQDLPVTWTEIFYASCSIDEPVLKEFDSFPMHDSGIDIYQIETLLVQDFKRHYEATWSNTNNQRSLLLSIQLLSSLLESILSLSYDNEIAGWKFSDSGGGQTLYEKLKSKFQLTKDRLRRTSLKWFSGASDPIVASNSSSESGPKSWSWLYFLCGSIANTVQNGRVVLADAVALVDHCYKEIIEVLSKDPGQGDTYAGLLSAAVQLEPLLILALVEKFVWSVTCSLRALLSYVAVKMNDVCPSGGSVMDSEKLSPAELNQLSAEIVRVLLSIPAPWSGPGLRSDIAGEITTVQSAAMSMHYRLHDKSMKSLASTLSSISQDLILAPIDLQAREWKAAIQRKLPAFVINLDFRFGRWRSMSTMLSQPAGRGLFPIRIPAFNGVLTDRLQSMNINQVNSIDISIKDVSMLWDNSLHHHFDANCKTDTHCVVSTTERACAASHLFIWRLIASLADHSNKASDPAKHYYHSERAALFQGISRTASSIFGDLKSCAGQWPKSMPHRNILGKDSLQHWFIVLEDDAIALSPKYSHHCNLHESIVSLVERLPADCDICYLGYLPNALHRKQKSASCVGNRFVKVNYILGMHSYVIKESAVMTLLSNLPITGPVDCFVARLIYENYLVAYALVDPIFKQQLSLTQMGQMTSDVQPSGYNGRRRNYYKKSMQYHKK